MPHLLPVNLSVMIWLDINVFQGITCPTPSVPPSLLLLVDIYEKGNGFTAATRYRKISQGLTSWQFLKMKNNLNQISSHLCINNLLNNYNCVAMAKLSFINSQSHPKMWIQTWIKIFPYRLQGNGSGIWFLISPSLPGWVLFWKWKVKLTQKSFFINCIVKNNRQ